MSKQKNQGQPKPTAQGRRPKPSGAKRLVDNAQSIIVAVIFVVLVRQFAAETFNIPSISMEPTLLGKPGFAGDRLIADKLYYRWHAVERWDIAVFRSPEAEPGGFQNRYIGHTTFIKRMIGLPGEWIEISHGDVFITGSGLRGEVPQKPARLNDALWFEVSADSTKSDFLHHWDISAEASPALRDSDGALIIIAAGKTARLEYKTKTHEENTVSGIEQIYKHIANPVGDVMIEIHCRPDKESGALILEINEEGNVYTLEIPIGKGQAKLSAVVVQKIRPGLEDKAWDGSTRKADFALQQGKESTIRFSNADDRIIAEIDGRTIFDEYVPVQPAYVNDDDFEGKKAAEKNSIAFSGRDASLTLKDVRIYRDIYYIDTLFRPLLRQDGAMNVLIVSTATGRKFFARYDGLGNFTDAEDKKIEVNLRADIVLAVEPSIYLATREPYQVGPDEYFALGDNSPNSRDSRAWGCLKRQSLIGRAVVRFWPLPPFGPFRLGLVR